jgi:hypothetical protein
VLPQELSLRELQARSEAKGELSGSDRQFSGRNSTISHAGSFQEELNHFKRPSNSHSGSYLMEGEALNMMAEPSRRKREGLNPRDPQRQGSQRRSPIGRYGEVHPEPHGFSRNTTDRAQQQNVESSGYDAPDKYYHHRCQTRDATCAGSRSVSVIYA